MYPPSGTEYQPYAEIILHSSSSPTYGTNQTFNLNTSITGFSVSGDIPVEGNSAILKLTILSYLYDVSSVLVYCYGVRVDGGREEPPVTALTPPLAGLCYLNYFDKGSYYSIPVSYYP